MLDLLAWDETTMQPDGHYLGDRLRTSMLEGLFRLA